MKHKKKGLKGFQEFISYLELSEFKRASDILLLAWLEDPLYAQYLEPNIATFEYFLNELNEKDYEKIFKALPNGPVTFAFAFKNTPEHETLKKKLHPLIFRRLIEMEENLLDITLLQRIDARKSLIKKMRELQNQNEVSGFLWKLPSEKILKGEHISLPINGHFRLAYENGTLALEGGFENKLRAGKWTHFHPNGKCFAKGYYSEGEKIHHWSFFDHEEKLISEGYYIEDLRSGEWKMVDKKDLVTIVQYERGRVVS